MFAEFSHQYVGCLKTYGTPEGFAVLEYDKSRYGTHIVARSQFLILVYIYLDYVGFVACFAFHVLKDRALHSARATPCGEKIDQGRFGFVDYCLKIVHIFKVFDSIYCSNTSGAPLVQTVLRKKMYVCDVILVAYCYRTIVLRPPAM